MLIILFFKPTRMKTIRTYTPFRLHRIICLLIGNSFAIEKGSRVDESDNEAFLPETPSLDFNTDIFTLCNMNGHDVNMEEDYNTKDLEQVIEHNHAESAQMEDMPTHMEIIEQLISFNYAESVQMEDMPTNMEVSEQMIENNHAESAQMEDMPTNTENNELLFEDRDPWLPNNNIGSPSSIEFPVPSITEGDINAEFSEFMEDSSFPTTSDYCNNLSWDFDNNMLSYPYCQELHDIIGQNLNNDPTMEFEESHGTQSENNRPAPNYEIQNVQEDISALENQWLKALDGILELRKVYEVETTEIKDANRKSKKKNTSNTLARKETDHDKINEAEKFFKDQASTIKAPRSPSRNLESSDKEKPIVELIEKFRWWVIWKIFTTLRYGLRVKLDKTLRYAQFVTLPNFEEASSKLHSRRTKRSIQENSTLSNNSKLCPNVITSNCLLSSDMFGDRCSQTDLPDNFFLTFLTLLRETPIKRFRYVSYLKKGEYINTHHFYNVYMKGDHDNGDALLIAEQPQNNCLPDVSKLNEMLMIRFSNVLNIKKYTLALRQLDTKRLELLQQWLQSNGSDITGLLNNSIFVLRIRTSIVRENYDPEDFPNLSRLLEKVLGNNAIFLEFPLRYKFPSAGIKNLGQARKLYRDIMTKHIEGSRPVGFFEEITATDFSEKIQSFIHEDIREDILTKLNVVNRPVKLTFILPFNRLLYDKIKGRLRADGPSPAIKGYKTLFEHVEKLGVATEEGRKTSFKYRNKIKRAKKTKKSEQPSEEECEFVPYAASFQKWISDDSSLGNFLKFFTDLIKSKGLSIKLSIRIDLDENVLYPKGKIVISMDNKKEYFSKPTLEEDYKTKILRFFDDDQLDYFEAENPK